MLLAHAHSADRCHAAQLLESCLHNGELFSFLYRLIDTSGQLRRALIAAKASSVARNRSPGCAAT